MTATTPGSPSDAASTDLPPPSSGATDEGARSRASGPPRSRSLGILDGLGAFATGGVSVVAALAVVIEIATRAIAPCLRGLTIGLDAWIVRASFVQDVLSLTLLVATFAVGALQVASLGSSRTPLLLRALAMLGSGVTMLVMLASPSSERPPLPLLVTSAAAGSTVALLAAAAGLRDRTFRLPAIAAVGVAIGTMARTAAVFVAARTALGPKREGVDPSRLLATIGFGADMLVLLAVAGWIVTRTRRVAIGFAIVALGLAGLGARWSVVSPDDTGVLATIVRLGARMMMSRPVPLVPYYMEIFGVLASLSLAVAALLVPRQMRPLAGAVAVFAVVRSTSEIPVHASLVAVASLGMLLTQFSPKSFWSSVPDAAPLTR